LLLGNIAYQGRSTAPSDSLDVGLRVGVVACELYFARQDFSSQSADNPLVVEALSNKAIAIGLSKARKAGVKLD